MKLCSIDIFCIFAKSIHQTLFSIIMKDLKQISLTLKEIISTTKSDSEGWVHLTSIGQKLKALGIDYMAYGYLKLSEFITSEFQEILEVKWDESGKVPITFVRLLTTSVYSPQEDVRHKNSNPIVKLHDWAYFSDFRGAISDLAKMTLKERWHYKEQVASNPHPILTKYLIHTFFRLSKEGGKILTEGKYAAFDTGLVDRLYEPIYAVFEKNTIPNKQPWYFKEFCIPAQGYGGDVLVRYFNPLPQRAHYFDKLEELIYDINAPKPKLNWDHIILDNIDRLPSQFLFENAPKDFLLRNTLDMTEEEKASYYSQLKDAMEADAKTLRAIKNRFEDSLNLALKRITWNYKTAIPMYYPRTNKLSLLLPLSLMDDEQIDLALVTEKLNSGNYKGHTILPLEWAYSNARLVTRPDSDWLIADKIETKQREED